MPVGKSSIQRAANTNATAQKSTTAKTSTAAKTTSTKPAAPKKAPVVAAEHVIANISPEVVEKVIQPAASAKNGKVSIGQKMPVYLL